MISKRKSNTHLKKTRKDKKSILDLLSRSKFVDENFHFSTSNFKFTEHDFHLLRSRFPYRTIPYYEIESIEIVKGIGANRPLMLSLFGLLLILAAVYFFPAIQMVTGQIFNADWDFDALELYYFMLITFGFFITLGLRAIWQAIVPTWILKVYLKDHTKEVFALTKIKRDKKLNELMHFLMLKFKPDKLRIDRRLKKVLI